MTRDTRTSGPPRAAWLAGEAIARRLAAAVRRDDDLDERLALAAGLVPGGDAVAARMIPVVLPLWHMMVNDTSAKW